jgi:hypothetical protein
MIPVVMGVAGSGKTTVGTLLAGAQTVSGHGVLIAAAAAAQRTAERPLQRRLVFETPSFERLGDELDPALTLVQKNHLIADAERLSDGTLHYPCLLAILCHPEPPPLICIEETE